MSSKFLVKLFSIILPFIMVFAYYTLPIAGSLGPLILYIFLLLMLFTDALNHKVVSINIPKEFLYLSIYILITQPFIFLIWGGFDSARLINLISIYALTFAITYIRIDFRSFYRSYFFLGAIASVIIAIQFVQIFLMNQVVHQIMLLPVDIYESWYSGGVRPTGIFPEPATYGTFIVPLIECLLESRSYKTALLFTVAVFMSTSSLGIIVVGFLWCSQIFKSNIKNQYKISSIIAISIMLIIILQTSLFEYSINKIANINFSNDVRLTRGFRVYGKLDTVRKLFGIGVNNLNYYLETGKIVLTDSLSIGMRNRAYITGIFQVVIFYGLFGLLPYIILMVNNIRKSKKRILALAFVLISIASSFLYNTNWFVYMVIILNNSEDRDMVRINIGGKKR